jgi:hypothetical protein
MPTSQTCTGRVRTALAAFGRAVARSLATQHGWCLAEGIWYPHLEGFDPQCRTHPAVVAVDQASSAAIPSTSRSTTFTTSAAT